MTERARPVLHHLTSPSPAEWSGMTKSWNGSIDKSTGSYHIKTSHALSRIVLHWFATGFPCLCAVRRSRTCTFAQQPLLLICPWTYTGRSTVTNPSAREINKFILHAKCENHLFRHDFFFYHGLRSSRRRIEFDLTECDMMLTAFSLLYFVAVRVAAQDGGYNAGYGQNYGGDPSDGTTCLTRFRSGNGHGRPAPMQTRTSTCYDTATSTVSVTVEQTYLPTAPP